MERYGLLAGRILLAFIFLMAGFNKIMNFGGTAGYMNSVWSWLGMTPLFLAIAIILEVGGGLSLVLGFKTQLGAWALFIFMIPTTLLFHWPVDQMQSIQFMKNLSMMGGLLYVAAYGAGPLSLDGKMKE
jgi:putative oxidoreductase